MSRTASSGAALARLQKEKKEGLTSLKHLENRRRLVGLVPRDTNANAERNGRGGGGSEEQEASTSAPVATAKARAARPAPEKVRVSRPHPRSANHEVSWKLDRTVPSTSSANQEERPTRRKEMESRSESAKPVPRIRISKSAQRRNDEAQERARDKRNEEIKRLSDELRRLKSENDRLRQRRGQEMAATQDIAKWPRSDLLLLVHELEEGALRKPIQSAVRKIESLADVAALQERLARAEDALHSLQSENSALAEQLAVSLAASSSGGAASAAGSAGAASGSRRRASSSHDGASSRHRLKKNGRPSSPAGGGASASPPRPDIVPRLSMSSCSELSLVTPVEDDDVFQENEIFSSANEEEPLTPLQHHNRYLSNGSAQAAAVADETPSHLTDPSRMRRMAYEQIACDVIYAARATIARRRWQEYMERKQARAAATNQRLPRVEESG